MNIDSSDFLILYHLTFIWCCSTKILTVMYDYLMLFPFSKGKIIYISNMLQRENDCIPLSENMFNNLSGQSEVE